MRTVYVELKEKIKLIKQSVRFGPHKKVYNQAQIPLELKGNRKQLPWLRSYFLVADTFFESKFTIEPHIPDCNCY